MTNGQTKIWNKKPQELKANPSHAGKPVGMAKGGQDEKTWIYYIRKIPHHSLQWQGQQGKRAHHREPAGATALPPPGSEKSQPLIRQGYLCSLLPRADLSSLPAPLQKHGNIAPPLLSGPCGCLTVTAAISSSWGKAARLASCMMSFPELSGPGLAQGDSTHNSNNCKNFRDEHTIVLAKAAQGQTVSKVLRVVMKWLPQSLLWLQNEN